jgi:hypothetical protein
MSYLHIKYIAGNKKLKLAMKKGENMAKKLRCAAKTKEGKRCKNTASGKSKFCASHKKK